MDAFTIRDLENLSGIKAHTIRIWEQRYAFLKPKRSSTNIRYYDSDELKKLLNVALLNKYGFRISQIIMMDDAAMHEKIMSLSPTEAKQEQTINELVHAVIDLDAAGFEQILDRHIQIHGINDAIQHLIFPFLHRIGILWMTGLIRVAQEHLVTNIIRQKIIVGIEKVRHDANHNSVVMFLPDGEYHEIGLLYVHYLLKARGFGVTYLGADVPLSELEYVCESKRPDIVYTHLTCIPAKLNFQKYLSHLSNKLNGAKVIISGKVVQQYFKKLPDNVRFVKSPDEALGIISGA